jgi:hypothetical protein
VRVKRFSRFASLALALGVALAIALPSSSLADSTTDWTPGPNAILDDTYDGFIDAPAANASVPTGSFTVSGWFFDKTADGWAGADDVEAWAGTMDGGGRLLAKLSFAQGRPDVAAAEGNPFAAASGFGGVVPPNSLAVGPQTLTVYAHTPGKGWWFKQVNVNVSSGAPAAPAPAAAAPTSSGAALPIVGIERPKDGEQVLTKNDYDIIGFALDRNATPNQGVGGSGIDQVSVYLGAREEGGAFLGNADLGFSDSTPVAQYGGQFDQSGWRLTFHPTQFHANTYLLYAYAHSVVSGKEDNAIRYFAIREQTP